MSALFENAIDSLKVGMTFFLKDEHESSNKHAILTIFHSIELFLKEYLYRINPILTYRDIDRRITDDSQTVGIKEILIRLENLKVGLPDEQRKSIENIQKRRNRIEHHRYDKEESDGYIIGESLKFITFFVEMKLNCELKNYLESSLLGEIEKAIFDYQELESIASSRLEKWLKKQYPDWNPWEENTPDEFAGTVDCPKCNNTYLVIDGIERPFCFYCNMDIEAVECESCGIVLYKNEKCPYCANFDE